MYGRKKRKKIVEHISIFAKFPCGKSLSFQHQTFSISTEMVFFLFLRPQKIAERKTESKSVHH